MPTLAEITASPEALARATEDILAFHEKRMASEECMNEGVQSDEELMEMFNRIGRDDSIDYRKFCEIGLDD